jgi:hypothetical protein
MIEWLASMSYQMILGIFRAAQNGRTVLKAVKCVPTHNLAHTTRYVHSQQQLLPHQSLCLARPPTPRLSTHQPTCRGSQPGRTGIRMTRVSSFRRGTYALSVRSSDASFQFCSSSDQRKHSDQESACKQGHQSTLSHGSTKTICVSCNSVSIFHWQLSSTLQPNVHLMHKNRVNTNTELQQHPIT